MKGKWFLVLMWFDDCDEDMVAPRNNNGCGFFSTVAEAENALKENWECIWEHWCNTAVIEFIPEGIFRGVNPRQLKRDFPRRWFKIKTGTEPHLGENLEVIKEPRVYKRVYGISLP